MDYVQNLFDWFAGEILHALWLLWLGWWWWILQHTGIDITVVGTTIRVGYSLLFLLVSPWISWSVLVSCVTTLILLGISMILLRLVLWIKGHFWSASS